MKKRNLFATLFSLLVLGSMIFAAAVYAATIWSDGFELGNFNAWTSSGSGWDTGTFNAHSGFRWGHVDGNVLDSDLIKNQSTQCYENIRVEYWIQSSSSWDSGDDVWVHWSDGSTWTEIDHRDNNNEVNQWTLRSFNLPSAAADNPNFRLRFRATISGSSDDFYLDDVSIEGDLITNNSIGDFVYNTGAGNAPLSGVTVQLWNDNNNNGVIDGGDTIRTSTSTTNTPGANYDFTGLPAGDYVVRALAPSGYLPASQDHAVSVSGCGQDYNAADFGFFQSSTINGRVWYDDDRDGLQSGDTGIDGITVNLSGPIDVSVSTGGGGYFEFIVPAGTYAVTVDEGTLPAGVTYSTTGNNGASVTIAAGGSDSVDFGYDDSASIGDLVWLDSNGNGLFEPGSPNNETGIDGVTVNLLYGGNLVASDTTAGGGIYGFDGVGAPPVLGTFRDEFNLVAYDNNDGSDAWASNWVETDGGGASGGDILITGGQLRMQADNFSSYDIIEREANLSEGTSAIFSFDYNSDGQLETSDQVFVEVSGNGGDSWTLLETLEGNDELPSNGIGGPFTRSYDISAHISSNTRIRFRQTEFRGGDEYFYVDNVQISISGSYEVVVDESSALLAGYTATTPLTRLVNLNPGGAFPDADFGYGPFALVSGTIFEDTDRSGALNGGESGLPDITVWLYTDGNGNGKIDGSDSVVKTTSTSGDGFYYFAGINPGNYTVRADAGDPDLTAGFRPTSPNPMAVVVAAAGVTYADNNIGFNTPQPVTKPLYLKPANILDRNMPTGSNTATTIDDGSSTAWVQSPVLADNLVLTGDPIPADLYLDGGSGCIFGSQPNATVELYYEGGVIADTTFSVPGGIQLNSVTLTPTNSGPVALSAGQHLSLRISASCPSGFAGSVIVYYNGSSYPSTIDLPTYSYLNVEDPGVFDTAFPGGSEFDTFIVGQDAFIRVTASDPFGAYDISEARLTVPGVVTDSLMSIADSSDPNRTFETQLTGLTEGDYTYSITVKEGTEDEVADTVTGSFRYITSDLGSSTKTVDKATAAPGETLAYTIVLSNTGELNASVVMTDTLPPNVTFGGLVSGPGSYSAGDNAVLFSGPVNGTSQQTIVYTVSVISPLDYGTVIANDAAIDDGFNSFVTAPAVTTIESAPDLVLSHKSVDLATAAPNDILEYTIVITNSGTMNAYISSGNPIRDVIPPNTTFYGGLYASASPENISYNPGFNRVEWYGTVPAGDSVTLRFQAKTNYPLNNNTIITNTAQINEGTGFPAPQTYQRVATTTITSAPNLVANSAKLVDRSVASPGEQLAYTLRLQNTGNMNAANVTLTDPLPAHVSWAGDAFLNATGGLAQFYPLTNTLVWQGDVNAGGTVQIFFRVNVDTPLADGTLITNQAAVADAAGSFAPFNLQTTTTVDSEPNLSESTKTVNTALAEPGETLTYTLTLVNQGDAVANVSLDDAIPSQLENPVILSVSGGEAQIVGGNQITWTGQVTPGENVIITFQADLLPVLDNGSTVANVASIDDGAHPAFFIDPPAVTTIQSAPDLSSSRKTVDRATASPGDLLVYTIALTNTGNMIAETLVRDVLPPNVTFENGLSASPGAPLPTYSSINNRISWEGDVEPGAPITVSYQVRINTPLNNGILIQNNAEIDDGIHTPFETDPPATTIIQSAPDLTTSSKSVDKTTAAPGELVKYTIRLVNSGDMIATSVTLSDTLPVEVTFASGPFITGNGSGGFVAPQRRIFWNGFVEPGSDVLVEYYVTVNTPLPNGTEIINDAVIQGSFAPVTTDPVTTTVSSAHALTLVKNAPAVATAGGQIIYELDYSVTGAEPATGVTITDTVPANTSFAGCSNGCTQNGGVITWTLNNLLPGNSGTVQFTVNVTSPLADGTVIANTAYIFDANNGAPATSTANTTITSGHGFNITKADSADPVNAGANLTYTITWSVVGTEQAEGVVLTDTLPAGVSFVDASNGGAETAPGSGVVVWGPFSGPFLPTEGDTLTVTVTVDDPLPNGTVLENSVRISDDNGGLPGSAAEQTTVESAHTLTVNKTGPASVAAGDLITYTLDYAVDGNETALGVVIEDNTPANTTFVSASGPGSISDPGVGNSGLVRWNLGNLTDASGVVTLTVRVNSPLPNNTQINNQASIRDTNNGVTDSDSHTTAVTSGHTFVLQKTSTPAQVAPGGIINYTINWEVTGNELAQNVTITDAIPANTQFENCGTCVFTGDTVQWNLGNHAPGASGTVFFQVQVDTPLTNATGIPNTAYIFDTNGGVPVDDSTSNTVSSDHTLSVTKSASPNPVQAGGQLVYTINWAVNGNEPAPNVVISDTIPANTSYVAGSCTGGCVLQGNDLVWNLGNRNPGAAGTVRFTVAVTDVLANGVSIENTVVMSDDDAGTAADSDTIQTEVRSGHVLSVVKSDSADPVNAGQSLTYTIDWTLTGNETSESLTIVDTLPADVTLNLSATTPAPTTINDQTLTWNLGNRTPSDSGSITVVVTVANVLPDNTILLNQVSISDSNNGVTDTDFEQTTVNSGHTLTIAKSGPATVTAGGQINYTIAYTATGSEVAENVVIEDLVPANTTFVSASGAGNIDAPPFGGSGQVRWYLGNLAPGDTGTVVLTVRTVTPLDNGTVIDNEAAISDDNGGAPDSDSATTTVQSSHGFLLAKHDNVPTTIAPNSIINYTIDWQVTGSETAQSVTITDTIPANTSFVFCSGDCVLQGDTVRWTLNNRNPGQAGTVFLQVRVDSPLPNGTLITNTAHIFDSNGGAPVQASDTTPVASNHTLSLSKSGPAIVAAGDPLVYTLNYSVAGNEPAPNVTITDTVPANTSYNTCSGGINCVEAGGVVTWTLGNLNPGDSGSVQLSLVVDSPLPDGTPITNRAFIFDDDNATASDDAQTTVTSGHGYTIAKADAGYDPVQAGGQLVYTINWALEGNEDAQAVTIEDTLPANTAFASCEPAGQCGHSLGVVTWNLGDQQVGASGTVTVTVNVASPLDNGSLLSNFVEISDSNGGLVASDTEQTTVNASHTLTVDKVGPATVDAGGQITYTLTYSVSGNETAKNVTIEDLTPLNTTFASAQGGQSTDQPPAGTSGVVRWHLGNLPPNSTGVVTLTVNVNSPLNNGLIINNTAAIADTNGGTTDTDGASTTVQSGHAFILTKADTPDPSVPNGVINYTIHWEVTGNEPAQSLTITDAIPANASFENCGGCVPQTGFVQWNLGNRNPGDSGDLTLQVRVASPLPDGTVITNTARIFDANGGAPVQASTTTTVQSGHSLTLDKVAPATVNAGDQLVYTLNYAVYGNEPAPNVTITDTVPASTTFVAGSCGGCTESNGVLTWNLGTLQPNDTGLVQFTVNVDSPLPNGTPIRNTAHIFDTDSATGQDSTTTLVSSQHAFTIQKSDSGYDPVQAGGQVVYTINWGLTGNEVAQNVIIEDVLPANTTFAGCSAGCAPAGNTVTWNLGNLAPPVTGSVQLTVTVNSPLPNATLLTNQVNISDDNGGASASDSEQTTVASDHTLQVTKSSSPNPVNAGSQLTYTIAYTVTGNETAPDVVVEDVIPTNTTLASATPGYSLIGGLVRWNLGDLNPGDTGTLTLVVNVNSPLPNGTIIDNTVFIRDSDGKQASDNEQTSAASQHALTLTKTASPDPVRPEQIINYTLNWAVTGNESAANLVITDTIPANTSFWNCSSGCTQPAAGLVQWNLGSHAPGDSGTVNMQVRVNALTPNGTVITNTARIFDSNNGAPANASATTTVESDHILTLNKQGPATAQAGEQIQYTIDYAVSGDEIAPGMAITDAIPAGASYVANSCIGGINCFETGGIVTWAIGDQTPGSVGTVRFSVRVDDLLPNGTSIVNTAYVFDSDGKTATDDATTIIGSGGLSLRLTDNRETVQPGERITYTISFSGTEPLDFGTVGINLPANTSLVSASPGYVLGSDALLWFLVNQPSNFTGERFMVVELLPVLDNGTLIEATADIAGDGASNQDSDSATVVSSPDLSTSIKQVSHVQVEGGEVITYQIVLTNSGNMHAYQAAITDVIPAGMDYNGGLVASGGAPAYTNGAIHWSDEVRVGTPVEIEFTARISDTALAGTQITNIVQIDDGINEVLERSATVVTAAPAPPGNGAIYLPLIMAGSANPAPSGDTIELVIRNCSNTDAVGTFWVDLYINPNESSPYWPIDAGEGYHWFGQGAAFTVPELGANQSLALYLDDADPNWTNIPDPLPLNPRLYAQVDTAGNVIDEGAAGEANNIAANGSTACGATNGKADLIIESITRLTQSNSEASQQIQTTSEAAAPAPPRLLPPQR